MNAAGAGDNLSPRRIGQDSLGRCEGVGVEDLVPRAFADRFALVQRDAGVARPQQNLADLTRIELVAAERLLERGAEGDLAEAQQAIDRLADARADDGLVIREIWLLRLRALLARAHGDETGYRDYRDRYRAMATSLGFEGHMEWAEAMP